MMATRFLIWINTLVAAAILLSCQKTQQENDLSHDRDDPVRSHAAWNWVETTRTEFITNVLQQGGRSYQPVTGQAVVLEERAKEWVQRFDSNLREKYPEELANVPVPQVITITEKSPNAFISGAFTCYDIDVTLPREGQHKDALYLSLRGQGEMSSWPEGWKCLQRSKEELVQALKAFNLRNQDCQIKIEENSISPNKDCKLHDDMDGISHASRIVIPRTANWVTIHAGIYPFMSSERAFVGVIAHELGHYYRSHITSFADEYGYFYQMEDANHDHRPEPEPHLRDAGNKAIAASQLIAEALPRLDQQTMAPEVYLLAGSVAEYNCLDGSCPLSCEKIAKWEEQKSYTDIMGFYPFMAPSHPAIYSEFETHAKACLMQTTAGPNGELSLEKLEQLLVAPSWVPFASQLSPRGMMYVRAALQKISERAPADLDQADTAFEWVHDLSESYGNQFADASERLKLARENRLGYYTTEQESDEFAVEILNQIGFNPDAGVETYLALAGEGDDRMGGHIFGGKRCRELYKNKWKDAHGKEVFVPIGDYNEIHHSSCFRAFNADREIAAHGYPYFDSEPSIEGLSWYEIQNLAKQVSSNIATAPIGNEETSFALKDSRAHLDDCPFAPQHHHAK